MLSKIFCIVIVLNCTPIIVLAQFNDDSCSATAFPVQNCSQGISSSCRNATFIADRHAYDKDCSPIRIDWSMPMYNMTILFKNNITQPYSICIPPVFCSKSYHTLDDGREVQIKWDTSTSEPVCFKTKRSDRSIMKFRFDAGKDWRCYDITVRFSYKLEA